MLNELSLRVFMALKGAANAIESKFQDENGQTLAEYGLIMSVIDVAGVIGACVLFRTALVNAFNEATACLNGVTTGC